MIRNKPLPEDALQRLQEHARRGREAVGAGDDAAAEAEFLAAWECLPEPRIEYDHAQSISRVLTQFFRDRGRIDSARQWLAVMREAYKPGPSIDFMAATIDYESQDFDQAFKGFDALYKAYKSRPFDGYPKKYIDFYRQRAAER